MPYREPHPSLFRPRYRAWLCARGVAGEVVVCCYCDVPVRLHVNALAAPVVAHAAVLDHVLPRASTEHRHDNSPANVVVACWECNERKGERSPAQWVAEDPEAPTDAVRPASLPTERALGLVRPAFDLPAEDLYRGRPRRWSTPRNDWRTDAPSDEFVF